MPYLLHHGAHIYWEEHGAGEPLLLIMGLSFPLEMWSRILPPLSERYRVLVFDNRGAGRSDVPRGPYSMRLLAEDALAVIEAAGVSGPITVLGASMGGMVAQELALCHPDRVRALVLGCTACGGVLRGYWPEWSHSPSWWLWLRGRGEIRERALVPLLYAAGTPAERIEEDIRIRAVRQPPLRGILWQLGAILTWSSYNRLPRLQLPVLVIHGEEDHVLPLNNGRMIASRIPNAKFLAIPNAGHVLLTDQPDAVMQAVLTFLNTLP